MEDSVGSAGDANRYSGGCSETFVPSDRELENVVRQTVE